MQGMQWKVVIADDIPFYGEIEWRVKDLTNAVCVPGPCTTQEAFARVAQDCHAIAAGDFPIGERIIRDLDRCLVIAKFGVGVDPIDLTAARQRGIRVTNVPDYGMEDVASHAFAMMLALARHLPAYDRMVRAGGWEKVGTGTIHRIHGRNVGILGLGRIGKTFARQVSGMGCRVMANDPYLPPEVFAVHGVEQVDFATLIAESDYLSLHVPLNEETYHIIGTAELARMKPTTFLINTSRGGIVDQRALYEALQSGQIAGAGLDVFEDEPPAPDDSLLLLDSVILTPHVAWRSEDSKNTMASRVAEEIGRAFRGEAARCPVVDPPLRQSIPGDVACSEAEPANQVD
jgi:D-3-phosphoglycerate dehydrogenase